VKRGDGKSGPDIEPHNITSLELLIESRCLLIGDRARITEIHISDGENAQNHHTFCRKQKDLSRIMCISNEDVGMGRS